MVSIQTAEQILSDREKLIIGMKKYKRIMDSLYWTDEIGRASCRERVCQ